MSPFLATLLGIQAATFIVLGVHFLVLGDWRLGVTQLAYAALNLIIYSGRMV